MAWDTFLVAMEERFRSVVGVDGIPTAYPNAPTSTLALDGPPDDESEAGVWRKISWVTGYQVDYARGREYTPLRMYVQVSSLREVGIGPAVSEAESIRSLMDASLKASPIAGIHYVGPDMEFPPVPDDADFFTVNYVLRLLLEEAVG